AAGSGTAERNGAHKGLDLAKVCGGLQQAARRLIPTRRLFQTGDVVLSFLFVFGLLFLGIAVVLFAGTVVLQGALYSEPVNQLYWRAPLAGLLATLFFAGWCLLDYRSPGSYNALFDFTDPHDES